MSDLNTSLKAKLGGNAPFIPLVALYLLIEIAQPGFFAPSTQLGLLADSSTLFIMAAGTTFVVLIGSIDLSLQAVASLSSVIVALLLPRHGALAAGVALAASFGVGLLSGIIQTALRIPSFIATLAMGGIASAAALTLSGTRSIGIGQEMRSASLGWTTGTSLGVPHEILLGIAVFAFCLFLHRSTVFGRHTDAIGAGEAAAIASGLRGAVTGGSGGIARTLVGALLVSVARVGMTFVGISVFAQQIVFGLILIVAVSIAFDRSKVLIVK